MSDKRRMVEESSQLLKPGGCLIVITKNPRWKDKEQEPAGADQGIQGDWIYWKDLASIYSAAGFTDIELRPCVIGSYRRLYRNALGIQATEIISAFVRARKMRKLFDSLCESYLAFGRKP